jgi:two-component system cell cycle sensor histidine kinase/response regulator CckA
MTTTHASHPLFLRGAETILLAEDQNEVRAVVADILRSYGYCVLEAANGADALVIAKDLDRHIDLLLTDVIMPGMTGLELADHLKLLRPETPVLFMSGYTSNNALGEYVSRSQNSYIQKPFTPSSLAAKIRESLGDLHSTYWLQEPPFERLTQPE